MKATLEVTVWVQLFWRDFEAVVTGPIYAAEYFDDIEGVLEETVFVSEP